jgi:hypothetical protein
MCPLCIGSAALILTASGSAGGVTVIAAKVFGVRLGRTPAKVAKDQAIAKERRSTQT